MRSWSSSVCSAWSAAVLPPDCSFDFRCARSLICISSASLDRLSWSIEKASVAGSAWTRLLSTSAWLRSCTVATSATSSAMSQTATGPADDRVRCRGRRELGRADMRRLQAAVERGQHLIGRSADAKRELELDLPDPQAGQAVGVAERGLHAVAVADGDDPDR